MGHSFPGKRQDTATPLRPGVRSPPIRPYDQLPVGPGRRIMNYVELYLSAEGGVYR